MEEAFKYVDIFATKGLEYLLVIGFLVTLVFFWRFLNKTIKKPAKPEEETKTKISLIELFNIVDNLYYHQGHSWVKLEGNEVVSVGIDDFAQKLLGKLSDIKMPQIGAQIVQGEKALQVAVNSKTVEILSPVNGEVIAINEKVLSSPEIINQDPYENGWLLIVKVSKLNSNLSNLLTGRLARVWLENTVYKLNEKISDDKNIEFQDEKFAETGLAKVFSPEKWDQLAKDLLLTN